MSQFRKFAASRGAPLPDGYGRAIHGAIDVPGAPARSTIQLGWKNGLPNSGKQMLAGSRTGLTRMFRYGGVRHAQNDVPGEICEPGCRHESGGFSQASARVDSKPKPFFLALKCIPLLCVVLFTACGGGGSEGGNPSLGGVPSTESSTSPNNGTVTTPGAGGGSTPSNPPGTTPDTSTSTTPGTGTSSTPDATPGTGSSTTPAAPPGTPPGTGGTTPGSGSGSGSGSGTGTGTGTTPAVPPGTGTGTSGSAPPVLEQGAAWSDNATWPGGKPVDGAAVLIPAGKTVLLDENTPKLGELTIEGALVFKPGVTAQLSADLIKIMHGGALRAGSAAAPFTGLATITLHSTDINASKVGMGTRGILVDMGGKLELFGKAPAVAWTKLNDHAQAGTNSLTLEKAVDWKAGDHIVLAPTEWYGSPWVAQSVHDASTASQKLSIAAAAGTRITTTAAVNAFRWGKLQFATDSGMSLTAGTFTKPHLNVPHVLDERAEVGNLTRNIVIQAPDDDAWKISGFGAHVMVMDRRSSLQMDGVEMRRMGQQGISGRYPVHWHLLSYADGASASSGDVAGHFVRNSTVADSKHRCLVIHGTDGVILQNNICYNIKGHAIFIEDAVEQRNVIEGNLVMRVRSPSDALATTAHEKAGHMCGASAAYWLTNPNNTVRRNVAVDAQGNGFWLSYPQKSVKQGKNVPIRPNNIAHGPFEDNVAHSNGHNGLMLECAMKDDAGNLELLNYAPTTDGSVYDYTNAVVPVLKRITSTKNYGGYVNRVIKPSYEEWVSADNLGRAFSGAVQYGSTLKHSLVIGTSLNNRQPYPNYADPQLAVASYHSQMDITQNVFMNFKNAGNKTTDGKADLSSGVFGTEDYYIRPVEKGFKRNTGNLLINSDAGHRAIPPHLQAGYASSAKDHNWTLAGAILDPAGHWGAQDRYWVLDSPFLLTAGCTGVKSRDLPITVNNGLSCPGPYYGVTGFQLGQSAGQLTDPYAFLETIDVTRIDTANAVLGNWRVERGDISRFLGNMRHFAAVKDGLYILRFPQFPLAQAAKVSPRWVHVVVENMIETGDSFLLGVQFDGAPTKVALTPGERASPDATKSRFMSSAANRAAVAAAAQGDKYWHDSANGLVWVKIMPMPASFWNGVAANSDLDLYRAIALRIEK